MNDWTKMSIVDTRLCQADDEKMRLIKRKKETLFSWYLKNKYKKIYLYL